MLGRGHGDPATTVDTHGPPVRASLPPPRFQTSHPMPGYFGESWEDAPAARPPRRTASAAVASSPPGSVCEAPPPWSTTSVAATLPPTGHEQASSSGGWVDPRTLMLQPGSAERSKAESPPSTAGPQSEMHTPAAATTGHRSCQGTPAGGLDKLFTTNGDDSANSSSFLDASSEVSSIENSSNGTGDSYSSETAQKQQPDAGPFLQMPKRRCCRSSTMARSSPVHSC